MIWISVTGEHLKAGTPAEADCCAVALSLIDSGYTSPYVNAEGVDFTDQVGDRLALGIGTPLIEKLDDYDLCLPMQPFEFSIDFDKAVVGEFVRPLPGG